MTNEELQSDLDGPGQARWRVKAVERSILLGPRLFEFRDFNEWVDKARDWFASSGYAGGRNGGAICLDQRGRICDSGKEMMRARDEDEFPVVVYAKQPLVNGEKP